VFEHVDKAANMTFEVYGKCALYAATYPDPTPDKFERKGQVVSGGQVIKYIPSETVQGMYYISVYPDGEESAECSVLAFTSLTMIKLLDGVPVYINDVCKWCYRYYDFDVVDPQQDVTITVLPLDEGDPDVYGAFDFKPTTTNYTWSSMRVESDSFTVLHTHSKFKTNAALYISVFGWSNAQFAIMASTSASRRFLCLVLLPDACLLNACGMLKDWCIFSLSLSTCSRSGVDRWHHTFWDG
jgi:hypothetical protein